MRDAVCFPGEFGDVPDFRDGAAEGFLTVNVLAGPHGGDTGHGMGVIGSGHHHRIEVLLLYQLAEIAVGPGGGELPRNRGEAVLVDVTEGCDIGDVLELTDAVTALSGGAHHPDIQFVVCGGSFPGPQDLWGGCPAGECRGRGG